MENIASKFGPWGLLILFLWRFATQLQSAIERIAIVGEAVAVKLGAEVPAAPAAKRAWFLPVVAILSGASMLGGCAAVEGAAKGTVSTCNAVGGATMGGVKKAVCNVVDTLQEVGYAVCGDKAKAEPAPAPAPKAEPAPAPAPVPPPMDHTPPGAAPPCGPDGCQAPPLVLEESRHPSREAYVPPRRR